MTITSHHPIWENDTTNRDRDAYRILLTQKKELFCCQLNYREHIDINVFKILRGYILKLIFFIPFTIAWPSSF